MYDVDDADDKMKMIVRSSTPNDARSRLQRVVVDDAAATYSDGPF
jgi:hypothetical protein